MKHDPEPQNEISHVDFANSVLHSRRTAIGLSVDQIQQMAGAILVLDHDLNMAQDRAAQMLVEASAKAVAKPVTPQRVKKPAPVVHRKIQIVRVVECKKAHDTKIIEAFLQAHDDLEMAKFSSGENHARQKFEKAAMAMVGIYKPKG